MQCSFLPRGGGGGRVGEGRPRGRPWGSGPGGVGPWGSGVCLRRTDHGPHKPPSGVGKARGVAGVHRTPTPVGTSMPANSGACGGTWGRGRVNVCGRLRTRGRWWPHFMQTTSWNETGPGPLSPTRTRERSYWRLGIERRVSGTPDAPNPTPFISPLPWALLCQVRPPRHPPPMTPSVWGGRAAQL